ncbi:MAG: hypothetical protein J6J11_03490 [Treponema sp.]|nr:hypothetical protein [Clostridia bacterium]MBP3607361.1 hypothetical protein [Treponema sp.]
MIQKIKEKIIEELNINDPFGITHMPFVFYDKNNKKCLLFDIKCGLSWHLFCFQNDELFKINTPNVNTYISECNGMVYFKNGLYHLTYTLNDMTVSHREIMHATGKTLKKLSWQEGLDYEIGLVNEKYICAGYISRPNRKGGIIHFYHHNQNDIKSCINDDNKIFTITTPWHFAKMGFISNQQDNILVTYVPDFEMINGEGTCLINVPNKTVQEIKLKNGDAAYKASIDPITKECYYAKRHSGFEVRDIQVVQENEYELIETDKIVIKN